jgi:putative spermidine/putrescine transport system ATP-binding protein
MTMGSGLSSQPSAVVDSVGQPAVRVRSLRKLYGSVVALAGIDLEIEQGEFFTLLGPSGSGKTTLLRLIAGFERPDGGAIELAGRDISGVRSPASR